MKIVPLQLDEEGIKKYSRMLKTCFPSTASNSKKFSESSLTWLYINNPDGLAIGFDAFDEGQLVAHYVCIPTTIIGPTGTVMALLSLNTATIPKYQGRGLFTHLARATFSAAMQQGFSCVYGVSNKNSTPGFVKKLGFDLVAPLEAFIGIGRIKPRQPDSSLTFQRVWHTAAINWRCSNPSNPIRICQNIKSSAMLADTGYPFIVAYDEQWGQFCSNNHFIDRKLQLNLIIGLFPKGIPSTYFKIPNFLKPSPLNFIFKPLDPFMKTPERHKVQFTFLDFDAY